MIVLVQVIRSVSSKFSEYYIYIFSVNEDSAGQHLKDVSGHSFRFSVSIVDLDPKPFCKIPTYIKQDDEIVRAYREACGGEFSGRIEHT